MTETFIRRDRLGRRIGRNAWREYVTGEFRAALDAWERRRESGEDVGGWAGAVTAAYQMEDDEYRERFPCPRLKDFMVELSYYWTNPQAA